MEFKKENDDNDSEDHGATARQPLKQCCQHCKLTCEFNTWVTTILLLLLLLLLLFQRVLLMGTSRYVIITVLTAIM